ncbi:ubiquitin-domain-containing protein [Haematococcus lacustris]|uniref:Ubiquitin-domain-containing protein n=1 Tax=Haematococcus lacustris TaxID=44745 RepID=A0A699ZNJ3_HAELA|nr:ubiquitin-domain-containing protein [Haematococcus lacustris]
MELPRRTRRALTPRLLQAHAVYDARELIDLASARYQHLRDSCMPQLPALEDRVADGTPAVDLCLRRNNHQQEEHVDRALFNIVTGSAAAMKRLHFSSTAVPGMASAEGAVVLIPGMTSALLLAHEDGSLSMPPKHSVDAPSSLAEQLTVVAVCVRADIPVRVLCWTSLQQALVGCFATTHQPQPQARPAARAGPAVGARPAVTAKVEAAPQAKRARTENAPAGPVLWSLFVMTLTGRRLHVHTLHGASLVRDLKQAAQDINGVPPDQQRIIFAGRQLADDQLLQDCGLQCGSVVHQILRLSGD